MKTLMSVDVSTKVHKQELVLSLGPVNCGDRTRELFEVSVVSDCGRSKQEWYEIGAYARKAWEQRAESPDELSKVSCKIDVKFLRSYFEARVAVERLALIGSRRIGKLCDYMNDRIYNLYKPVSGKNPAIPLEEYQRGYLEHLMRTARRNATEAGDLNAINRGRMSAVRRCGDDPVRYLQYNMKSDCQEVAKRTNTALDDMLRLAGQVGGGTYTNQDPVGDQKIKEEFWKFSEFLGNLILEG